MFEAVIVGAVRTPIGRFGGALREVPAVDLAARAIQAVLHRSGVPAAVVEEVILGHVYQAGQGMNPARQAALRSGLPETVAACTVNVVCGSGLQALVSAADAVRLGRAEVVVCGGMENMSRVPYAVDGHRWGVKMGHGALTDLLLSDGLWDTMIDCHMGRTAENLAQRYGLSREEQDAYALQSQRRCAAAAAAGRWAEEIVPVEAPGEKGRREVVAADEHPRPDVTVERLAALPPAFLSEGTVTAGNASGLNDGAAALVVMEAERARREGREIWACVGPIAAAGVPPALMGLGPAAALRKLAERAGVSWQDADLIELNEAFAAQVLAVGREVDLPWERVNVNGGAIALGHPLGASGARIVVTLLHEMRRRGSQRGLATLCIGGGMGLAVAFERKEEG
jgi:acetyl-CoA C-acetyltransferase